MLNAKSLEQFNHAHASLFSLNNKEIFHNHMPVTTFSPNMSIMHGLDSKSGARSLGNKLVGELWACPMGLHHFLLTKFKGLALLKK